MRQKRPLPVGMTQMVAVVEDMGCHSSGTQDAVALHQERGEGFRAIMLQGSAGVAKIDRIGDQGQRAGMDTGIDLPVNGSDRRFYPVAPAQWIEMAASLRTDQVLR